MPKQKITQKEKKLTKNEVLLLISLIAAIAISLLANISVNSFFKLMENSSREFYLRIFSISLVVLILLTFFFYCLFNKYYKI